MGKQFTIKEQSSAYDEYHLRLLKNHLRLTLQQMIAVREEELDQSDHNPTIEQQYLGYRMGLEDLYYGLYDEELPEINAPTVIDWSNPSVF